MKLSKLLDECKNYGDTEIKNIVFDTARVEKGSLFFCLKGVKNDGHDYAARAYEKGAAAVVAQRRVEADVPQIICEDTRHALSIAAKRYYGSAADRLKIFAVTGTNGKTTTTYMLKAIFESNGFNTGLIGTNAVEYGGTVYPATLTTPDPTELHEIFARMEKAGVTHVVMEASAHALALKKLDGIRFKAVGFTNLSRDHLDFFGDMENYKRAKLLLFKKECSDFACANAEDVCSEEIVSLNKNAILYGLNGNAAVRAKDLKLSEKGSKFTVEYCGNKAEAVVSLPGKYNVYNALCALSMALSSGISLTDACEGLKKFSGAEGRFETVHFSRGTVIVDFAHTDDGLQKLLSAVREFACGKVITVFGCGGNRDRTKRPVMGKIAAQNSDVVIVTSDNPRYERPEDIISDVENGIKTVKNVHYFVEPDRKKAVEKALSMMTRGDVTVIAGKGAEKYQEIKGVKYPYNDREYVLKLIGGEI